MPTNVVPSDAHYIGTASSAPMTLREAVRILRRRGLLIFIVFALTVVATLVLTSRMEPVYESSARLLIEPTSGAGSAMPNGLAALLGTQTGSPLETQIEKIRSRSFLSEVAKKANIKGEPTALLSKIKLLPAAGGQILNVSARGDTPKQAADVANLIMRVYRDYAIQEAQNKSALSTFHLNKPRKEAKADRDRAVSRYNAFLRSIGNSDPNVRYNMRAQSTENVQLAIENANVALIAENKKKATLLQQVNTTQPEILAGSSRDKNPAIETYRQRLYELEARRADLSIDYTDETDELREIGTRIKTTESLLRKALESAYSVGSKTVQRNPEYQAARQNLAQSDLTIDTLRAQTQANEALLVRLRNEQKGLAAEKTRYEDLQREKNQAVATYDSYTKGIRDIKLTGLSVPPNVRILDIARPVPEPISPKPLLNLCIAIGVGLVLGVGLALLVEYFSHPDADPHQGLYLPQVAGVPLLGAVPAAMLPSAHSATMGGDLPARQHAQLEDTFREIGHVLAHRTGPNRPAPVVLLTGTRSDEMTAAIAAQITATLVRDGLRVTLVDADRQTPRLNRVFGAPDAPGLAEALAGRARATDILHVGADGLLRFLAAGSPQNRTPTDTKKLSAIFGALAKDTDLVLISGPSVWTAQSVASLERAADGMALVAGPDVPAHESVARARRLLSNGYQPRFLGVVVSEGDATQDNLPPASQPTVAIEPLAKENVA